MPLDSWLLVKSEYNKAVRCVGRPLVNTEAQLGSRAAQQQERQLQRQAQQEQQSAAGQAAAAAAAAADLQQRLHAGGVRYADGVPDINVLVCSSKDTRQLAELLQGKLHHACRTGCALETAFDRAARAAGKLGATIVAHAPTAWLQAAGSSDGSICACASRSGRILLYPGPLTPPELAVGASHELWPPTLQAHQVVVEVQVSLAHYELAEGDSLQAVQQQQLEYLGRMTAGTLALAMYECRGCWDKGQQQTWGPELEGLRCEPLPRTGARVQPMLQHSGLSKGLQQMNP
jgi:hypothetical protein